MEPSEHSRYIGIECAWIVRSLRGIRDVYRAYLEDQGCRPIAEMYWVVFRFGVTQYAREIIQARMFDYIDRSKVNQVSWEKLFGRLVPPSPRRHPSTCGDELLLNVNDERLPWAVRAQRTIEDLTQFESFGSSTGGPFGKEQQEIFGLVNPWPTVHHETLETSISTALRQHIQDRQRLWDDCFPWTEGLARFYDATEQELFFQNRELKAHGGQQARMAFDQLSPLEKFAFEYLADLRRGNAKRNFENQEIVALLGALDQANVPLGELSETARKVRNRLQLRQKRDPIDCWLKCDNTTAVILDDGKPYTLRREAIRSIYNAETKAARHLGKVWNVKETASNKPTGGAQTARGAPRPKRKVVGKVPNGPRGERGRKALSAHQHPRSKALGK